MTVNESATSNVKSAQVGISTPIVLSKPTRLLLFNTNAVTTLQLEYTGIFEATDGNLFVLLISIASLAVSMLVFSQARTHVALLKAKDAQNEAEREANELRESNIRIRKELELGRLNKEQSKMIKENSGELETVLPTAYHLNWRELKFKERIGSGSFGDCYSGEKGRVSLFERELGVICPVTSD